MTSTINNVKTINATGAIFIIPNHIDTLDQTRKLWNPEKLFGYIGQVNAMKKLYELNNLEFSMDDSLFQYWIVLTDGITTADFRCHTGLFTDENGEKCRVSAVVNNLPKKLFEGYREGDYIEINVPADIIRHSDESEHCILHLTLKLAQREYRYRNHGTFEEIMARV